MIRHKVKTEQKEFLRIFFKSLQPKVRAQIWLLMFLSQTNWGQFYSAHAARGCGKGKYFCTRVTVWLISSGMYMYDVRR